MFKPSVSSDAQQLFVRSGLEMRNLIAQSTNLSLLLFLRSLQHIYKNVFLETEEFFSKASFESILLTPYGLSLMQSDSLSPSIRCEIAALDTTVTSAYLEAHFYDNLFEFNYTIILHMRLLEEKWTWIQQCLCEFMAVYGGLCKHAQSAISQLEANCDPPFISLTEFNAAKIFWTISNPVLHCNFPFTVERLRAQFPLIRPSLSPPE